MLNFNGYGIIITPDFPKLQLSDKVDVSPEFRKRIDAWLVESFGYIPSIIADGDVIRNDVHRTLHMNRRTYEKLERALKL